MGFFSSDSSVRETIGGNKDCFINFHYLPSDDHPNFPEMTFLLNINKNKT